MSNDKALQSLRDALRVSPDNIPLRLHLAETLAGMDRYQESEAEYRAALKLAPQDRDVKLALAICYWLQEKTSQAMVIVEDLVGNRNTPPAAHILHAKLLYLEGDVSGAVARYKLGIEEDPEVADELFGEQLGVGEPFADSEVSEGRVREGWHEADEFEMELERPEITFADVGGMDAVKEEISIKILYPLQHPEMYEAYGKSIGGGILMYGPPGCGKTYLARATAGEIGAGFISVGISDVLDMWIGQSERNLASIFEQARMNSPCVLFFDEVDALGSRRSDVARGGGRQLINQFLAEMDGVDKSNEGVLVLAATNAPWHVDPAFRRPGRFDQVLFVPPPDRKARAEILRLHCRDKPVEAIDYAQIAKKAARFSGADMKAIVDQAVEMKLREAMKAGIPQPLATRDLLAATRILKPTSQEWFSTAKNYALYSNQGGLYDDVLKYLQR